MKKNISINISGIVFHIGEDGYDQLKEYLESINRYFTTFEDSKEIIADIESRIAEIFLAKLKDGQQVVTNEDVNSLIATMGTIADFEAIEEQESKGTVETITEETQSETAEPEAGTETTKRPKRLYRDTKRKLLGGVAAGVAHYFNIDPMWIRLLLIILLFNIFIGFEISGVIVIAYIICWIVIPPSKELVDDKKLKKMYRSSEDRVLGGVASGVAAYFGTEVVLIRLLFVLTLFLGGSGLVIYIILWIITPEAKTITEKMQMQGEPVTLSNIESNVKKSLNVKEGEENLLVKILLFPFRLIAAVVSGLGKVLGPILLFLVEAIRILTGIIITIVGLAMILCLIVATGVTLGLLTSDLVIWSGHLPMDFMAASIPSVVAIACFFALLIPALALSLLGIVIIAKRSVMNTTVGWSLFAVWIISLITLSFTIPPLFFDFRTEGSYKETQEYDLQGKTAVLKFRETGLNDYHQTSLKLRGHNGPQYELVQVFMARGSSRQQAEENARMVSYKVTQKDSVLIFDSNFTFNQDSKFRAQELDITLYIPFGEKFLMEEDLKHILRSTLYRDGYSVYQMEGNTWTYTQSGLECITCARSQGPDDDFRYHGYSKDLEIGTFDEITLSGIFKVRIRKGDQSLITLSGHERYVEQVDVYNNNGQLEIEWDRGRRSFRRRSNEINVNIITPELKRVDLGGASNTHITGFSNDNFSIQLNDKAQAEVDLDLDHLQVVQEGTSELELQGNARQLEVELHGASKLNAFGFAGEEVSVETHGASNAKVNALNTLEINATGVSSVRYRGNAVVEINKSRTSTVRED